MHVLNISTVQKTQMLDITGDVRRVVQESGIRSGACVVFVPHTTAGITINENADPEVISDMLKEINKIVPFDDRYQHVEGNSAAHIKASLFGASLNILVEDGRLVLGQWQGIYFCEFDAPRNRKVYINMLKQI